MSLRFCMLTTFYPPFSFGGDAIGVQRLSRALVRRGHQVTVVHDVDAFRARHHGPMPQAADDDDDQGVRIIRLRSALGSFSPFLVHQLGRPVLHARRLRNLLRPGDWDVVNFHNVSLIGGPGLLGYPHDAVTLYMAHEHWLVCPTHVLWRHGREPCTGRQCLRCTLSSGIPPQVWRYTGALARGLRHVDAVIALSEFSRRKHREFGLETEMELLPCFLPESQPGVVSGAEAPWSRPYFLFAGRLERIKGLDDVIPVFRGLPDADLVIAGEGEHESRLRELAAGLQNVHFIGRLSLEQLERYYAHALAVLVPSVCFETFGNVLIEAFTAGTPVVARRLGPFPEIIAEAGAGDLFETPEELHASLRRLLDDPGLRDRLAAAARASAVLWSEATVVPAYLDIVRRAALKRGRTAIVNALAQPEAA